MIDGKVYVEIEVCDGCQADKPLTECLSDDEAALQISPRALWFDPYTGSSTFIGNKAWLEEHCGGIVVVVPLQDARAHGGLGLPQPGGSEAALRYWEGIAHRASAEEEHGQSQR